MIDLFYILKYDRKDPNLANIFFVYNLLTDLVPVLILNYNFIQIKIVIVGKIHEDLLINLKVQTLFTVVLFVHSI